MTGSIVNLIYLIREKCTINDDLIRLQTPLSPSEYRALVSLNPGEQITSTSFSQQMGLSPSRGSRVIDKLVVNGFVKRDSVVGDRRTILVSLAPKGVELKTEILGMLLDCEKKIQGKLTDSEYKEIEAVLRRLVDIL